VPAIADVYYNSWHTTFDSLIPEIATMRTPENCLEIWQENFASTNPKKVFLVAAQDNKIIGVSYAGSKRPNLAGFTNADCQLYTLYVLPACQGQGIGKALLIKTFEELSKHGFTCTVLESLESNSNANLFYEKMGGQVVGHYQLSDQDQMYVYEFQFHGAQNGTIRDIAYRTLTIDSDEIDF
jgi:ribosomal protein S18 acetylase RimI-like enzyme